MRIVVCIKQVPDTTEVRIDPETNTLIREGVASILNPLDAFAIEGAVSLCERHGGEAIALSMGPPQAEQAVREALAQGCTRGILLTDRAFAGSDTWATSFALAAAVRRIGDVDLVLCGKQAIDGDTAQVGPGMAAHLGWPQATYVREFVELQEGCLVVVCLTDHGDVVLRVALPAVLTVLKDLNIPRLPTLKSQMQARRCQIETWTARDLGLDERTVGLNGSPTTVRSIFAPPSRGEAQIWEGDAEQCAATLLKALKDKGVL